VNSTLIFAIQVSSYVTFEVNYQLSEDVVGQLALNLDDLKLGPRVRVEGDVIGYTQVSGKLLIKVTMLLNSSLEWLLTPSKITTLWMQEF
jgi:hypothetical protein